MFAGAVAALLHAFAAPASAEAARTASVEWRGPGVDGGCLGESGLVAAVEDGLGRRVFGPRPSEIVLAVSIERREGFGWRAQVEVRDARGTKLGERELVSETDSCASLNEPLVFAVMLMVDDELSERARSPLPKPEQPPRTRAAESAGGPTLAVDGAVIGAFGVLPEPTLGADLGGQIVFWRWLGVRGHVVAMIPRARSVSPSAETRFGLYTGGLLLCPGAELSPLHLAGCAGGEAGILTADSRGFDGAEDRARPFLAFSAGVRASVPVAGRSRITASANALFPQRRERFVYGVEEEQRVLFEMTRVCATVGIGAALQF